MKYNTEAILNNPDLWLLADSAETNTIVVDVNGAPVRTGRYEHVATLIDVKFVPATFQSQAPVQMSITIQVVKPYAGSWLKPYAESAFCRQISDHDGECDRASHCAPTDRASR